MSRKTAEMNASELVSARTSSASLSKPQNCTFFFSEVVKGQLLFGKQAKSKCWSILMIGRLAGTDLFIWLGVQERQKWNSKGIMQFPSYFELSWKQTNTETTTVQEQQQQRVQRKLSPQPPFNNLKLLLLEVFCREVQQGQVASLARFNFTSFPWKKVIVLKSILTLLVSSCFEELIEVLNGEAFSIILSKQVRTIESGSFHSCWVNKKTATYWETELHLKRYLKATCNV